MKFQSIIPTVANNHNRNTVKRVPRYNALVAAPVPAKSTQKVGGGIHPCNKPPAIFCLIIAFHSVHVLWRPITKNDYIMAWQRSRWFRRYHHVQYAIFAIFRPLQNRVHQVYNTCGQQQSPSVKQEHSSDSPYCYWFRNSIFPFIDTLMGHAIYMIFLTVKYENVLFFFFHFCKIYFKMSRFLGVILYKSAN